MIQKRKLKLPKSIVVDANDFPDLVPALAVAALCNDVEIKFKNVSHLRLKESDRVQALVITAKQFGANAKVNGKNSFTISRTKQILSPSIIPTFNDHRLAMAFSIMSTRCENVVVENALVVKKSFPGYWHELKKIGFNVTKA